MELAVCPTCKQSVLDDDATECPFCGSPMKAGGGPAKPTASATTASGRPAAARTSPSSSKPTAKPAAPDEDDPFSVDPSIAAKAIPLAAKAAPGRSFEVKCPMCETIGFSSSKVVGNSVRCCNPQCMVPVFTVKGAKKESAPPPPPPKPKSPVPMYVGGGLLVVALAGGTLWYLNGVKPPDTLPPIAASSSNNANSSNNNGNNSGVDIEIPVPDNNANAAKVQPENRDGDIKASITRAVEAALQAPSAMKPACRRFAALAWVHANDKSGFDEQLSQLKKVSAQSSYEAIQPIALAAWRFHAAGSAERAALVTELKQLGNGLPKRGRFATESAIAIAALQADAGDHGGGREILAAHRAAPRVEQLAALVQVVSFSGSFDLSEALPGRSTGSWQAPLETAVTLQLLMAGNRTAASEWATSNPDSVGRDESILVLIEHVTRSQPETPLDSFKGVHEKLSPAGKVRLATRLSHIYRLAKKEEESNSQLMSAVAQLNSLAPAAGVRLPNLKSVIDAKVPQVVPMQQAAWAAVELARVQVDAGKKDDAWKSIQRGLQFLRSAGPTVSSVMEFKLRSELENAGELRKDLKKLLALANDDQAQREVAKFRTKVEELEKGANSRFQGQAEILSRAVAMGLYDEVWKEAQEADGKENAVDRDRLLGTALPILVAQAKEDAGQKNAADTIRQNYQNRVNEAEKDEALRVVPRILQMHLSRGEVAEASQLLTPYLAESGEMQREAIELVCYLIETGKYEAALQFVASIPLASLREDGLFLLGARIGRIGKQLTIPSMKVTEVAAINAGLAAGWGEARLAKDKRKDEK